MTGQGSLVLTLPWIVNLRLERALLLALAASCGTHQLVTFERLGRGALTPHTQGPEMQIKAGDSPTLHTYPGTTLAATLVERHHRVRHKLRV